LSNLRTLGLVAVAAVVLSLTACSTTADTENAAASDGVFPVTIEHVYGTTTIEEKPERIATVAWANHEVPLALGIVPVGMSKVTWGDDNNNGILPWVEDKLEELDAETPVLFDETDGIDFEAVADTAPDLILASYSGITQEEYDTLSKIAPVVAYPEVAWATPLDEMILMNSKALGLEEEGKQLAADVEAQIDDAIEANSEIKDKTVLFSFLDPADFSQIGFYTTHDTRPGFLADNGLPMPAIVEEESKGTDEFYVTVSAEEADRFDDVDVFVTYGDPDGELIAQMQADPLLSQIPAIASGSIVILQDSTPLAASANPSPLSIGWGVDEYFGLLASTIQPAG
jgi:iron complex transport system substrate-binding protein